MPLEYKPNFTSASGGGGFVTGYHGTPDNFTQQKAPDFEGAMKTLAGVTEKFKGDAFEQGKLDQLAGEIDSNKILFKDTYLAGAEYATSFQKLAELQSYIADESNKALGRGESAEEFYSRISPKIAEYRDSYSRIKLANPEAGTLLTNNLMNLATGALQNYGNARLTRAYEHRKAGSVTTATAAIVGPLQNPTVNSAVVRDAILQSIPAIKADARSMGLNEEQYVSDVLTESFKNAITGLNFNESNHQAWLNVMRGTIRDLVDGGVIDRAKSTELLTQVHGRIQEATKIGLNQMLIRVDEQCRAGTYDDAQRELDVASVYTAMKDGLNPADARAALHSIATSYANANKDRDILNSIPTDKDSQNRQATAFVKQHSGESPSTLVQNAVAAIKQFKNGAIADKIYPVLAESAVGTLSSDPKNGEVTTRDLENLGALAYSWEATSSIVDKDSVYKNDDVRDFMFVPSNVMLMKQAGLGDTNAARTLRDKWASFISEKRRVMSKTDITDEDVYQYISNPFSSEVKVKHEDVEIALMNSIGGSVQRYSPRIIVDKDQYIGWLNELRFEDEKSGLVVMSPMDYKDVFPSLYAMPGVDHRVALGDALSSLLRSREESVGNRKLEDLVMVYDPKSQYWLVYDGEQDTSTGVMQEMFHLNQSEVESALRFSVYKQQLEDQGKAERTVVGVAYSEFDNKAEAPSMTIVDTPSGRIGVVNLDGFTTTSMLQGLSEVVDSSTASDDLKENAKLEIEIAKRSGSYFKDDASLRQAVEACTGMKYDTIVGNILSKVDTPVELESDYDTPHIGASAIRIAKQTAIQEASRYYTEQIRSRAGSAALKYETLDGTSLNLEELGKVSEYILNGIRDSYNPWGDKNVRLNEDTVYNLKESLLNIGAISDSRLQSAVYQATGRTFDEWISKFKKDDMQEENDSTNKVSVPTNSDWFQKIKSLRKPMTIYGTWNKTMFGNLGTEFAKELEKDEGFLVDWINTRSPKDQQDTSLKQVEIIGLGFVKDGYPAWQSKFDAARGDPDKLSQVTADFAVWYYKDIPTKLDAYGFDIREMQTNPDLKPALFALGSFLWHQGRGSNAYLKAMQTAKTDLNKAYSMVKETSAYKQSGASRQRRYLEGIKAVAIATM